MTEKITAKGGKVVSSFYVRTKAAIKERAKMKAIDSKKGKPVEASQLTSEELAEKAKARKLEKNKKRRERQKASADVEAGHKAK